MDMANRKLFIYIAMSLDGYIAMPGGDMSFLSIVEKEGEDYGYADFIKTVDTVIVGRKTYDWVMTHVPEFAHTSKEVYVITKSDRTDSENLHFYSGDIKSLVLSLKAKEGKNIFCDGGAQVVNELLALDLIDEYIISIIPVFTGGGTRLFADGRPQQAIKLISTKQFDTGLVQLHYKREY